MLVRKSIGEHVSVAANYYIDMVSSASVDVETSASPYEDERTQASLSVDFLLGKSTYSIGYVNSDESDYQAKTMFVGVSHDMFGDLTTISFRLQERQERRLPQRQDRRREAIQGPRVPGRDGVEELQRQRLADHHQEHGRLRPVRGDHRRGLPAQPVSLGALLHRHRSAQGQQAEIYPNTRSSNAASVRAKYFLPYRAAIDTMYRFYTDTWGVVGHTGEIGYVHPLDRTLMGGNWTFEGRLRYYTQTKRGFLPGHLPARGLRELHGARQGTGDLQRHHRRRGRHVRIQDRALPVALQGPAQLALRLHDRELRRLPRRALQPRQASATCRTSRSRRAPSRCTSSTRTSSSSTSARSSRWPSRTKVPHTAGMARAVIAS